MNISQIIDFCFVAWKFITVIYKSRWMSGIVHTRNESLQDRLGDRLGDIQTCRMILASVYMLYHLSTTWL